MIYCKKIIWELYQGFYIVFPIVSSDRVNRGFSTSVISFHLVRTQTSSSLNTSEGQKGRNSVDFIPHASSIPIQTPCFLLLTALYVSSGQIKNTEPVCPPTLSQEALLHLHTLPCFTNNVSKCCWQPKHVSHTFWTPTQAFAMGVILFHSPYFSG